MDLDLDSGPVHTNVFSKQCNFADAFSPKLLPGNSPLTLLFFVMFFPVHTTMLNKQWYAIRKYQNDISVFLSVSPVFAVHIGNNEPARSLNNFQVKLSEEKNDRAPFSDISLWHHSLSAFARVCESNFSNSMVSTSLKASMVAFNYQGNYCKEFVRD